MSSACLCPGPAAPLAPGAAPCAEHFAEEERLAVDWCWLALAAVLSLLLFLTSYRRNVRKARRIKVLRNVMKGVPKAMALELKVDVPELIEVTGSPGAMDCDGVYVLQSPDRLHNCKRVWAREGASAGPRREGVLFYCLRFQKWYISEKIGDCGFLCVARPPDQSVPPQGKWDGGPLHPTTGERYATCDVRFVSLPQDDAQRKKRVLLVGEAGAGKSCLVQLLNGVHLVDKPAGELSTDDIVAFQRLGAGEVSTKSIKQLDVAVGGHELCLIDTPGFADNSGTPAEGSEDRAHARFVAGALSGAEILHCVLLVVNGTKARLNPSVGHTIQIIRKHMPREIMQKTIVVFTYVESENRRPFAVEQLAGTVFDGEPPKERLVHLENPLGQLTGMSESDLRAMLDGDDADAKDDLRREIKKGVKVAKDLVNKMQAYSATRCS